MGFVLDSGDILQNFPPSWLFCQLATINPGYSGVHTLQMSGHMKGLFMKRNESEDSFSSIFKPCWCISWKIAIPIRTLHVPAWWKVNLLESFNKTYLWSFKHRSRFVRCWWALFFHLFGNVPNLSQVFLVTSEVFNKHVSFPGLCLISQFLLKISETVRIVAYRTHTWGHSHLDRNGPFVHVKERLSRRWWTDIWQTGKHLCVSILFIFMHLNTFC